MGSGISLPNCPANTTGPYNNAIRFGLSGIDSVYNDIGNVISTLSLLPQLRAMTI